MRSICRVAHEWRGGQSETNKSMETNFKVGDKVRGIKGDIAGCEAVIVGDTGSGWKLKFTKIGNKSWHGKGNYVVGAIDDRGTYWDDYLELLKRGRGILPKTKPVKFALQYELDSDPTEYFATLPEVKARIKELAGRSDLKRESIFIHTLAKTQNVELGTSITIRKV